MNMFADAEKTKNCILHIYVLVKTVHTYGLALFFEHYVHLFILAMHTQYKYMKIVLKK